MSYVKEEVKTDVLVIGGGIAGIAAALKANARNVEVTIAVKGAIFRSGCSPFFDGYNYFNKETDNREEWRETLKAKGEYLTNLDALDSYMDDSYACYQDLETWGAVENRHVLRDRIINSNINTLERVMITDLILQDGKIAGAVGIPFDSEEFLVIKAKAVVICTGAGGFKPAGFPIKSLTHDGDAMAYRVGARITGKEFVDTHFTSSENPASGMIGVSNEIQTIGGLKFHPFLDLSREIKAHQGEVPIDRSSVMMRAPGTEKKRPGGSSARKPGRPSGGGGSIVGGSAAGLGLHKGEGIWPVDSDYSSGVPGLYAAGDACASMLGGAVYSILGCSSSYSMVQGSRAAIAAAKYCKKNVIKNIPEGKIDELMNSVYAPRQREKGYSPTWVTQLIQYTMIPYYVTFVKKEDRLKAALSNIEFMRDHFAPNLRAEDQHGLRLAHETKNMLLNAEMKLKASLFRTESRGVHYREDLPARDDENWLVWVMISLGKDGKMKLEKEPVPDEWQPDPGLSYEERYPERFPGEIEFRKRNSA